MTLKNLANSLKQKLQQGVQTAGNAWNGYVQNVAKPMAVGVPQVQRAIQSIPAVQSYNQEVQYNKQNLPSPFFNNTGNNPQQWLGKVVQDVKKRGPFEGLQDLTNPIIQSPKIYPYAEPLISGVRSANYQLGRPSPLVNNLLGQTDSQMANPNVRPIPDAIKTAVAPYINRGIDAAKQTYQVRGMNAGLDVIKGFFGENAAANKRAGTQNVAGNPSSTFTPSNNFQKAGQIFNDLLAYQVGIGPANEPLAQGTQELTRMVGGSQAYAKASMWAQKTLDESMPKVMGFLNRLKANPLTFEDAQAVTRGKGTPEQINLYKQANEQGWLDSAVKLHKGDPKMKVFDYVYDAVQKVRQAATDVLKQGEPKMLGSGMPEVAPATNPNEAGYINFGAIVNPNGQILDNVEAKTVSSLVKKVESNVALTLKESDYVSSLANKYSLKPQQTSLSEHPNINLLHQLEGLMNKDQSVASSFPNQGGFIKPDEILKSVGLLKEKPPAKPVSVPQDIIPQPKGVEVKSPQTTQPTIKGVGTPPKSDTQSYLTDLTKQQDAARQGEKLGLGTTIKNFYMKLKEQLVNDTAPITDTLTSAEKRGGFQVRPTADVRLQMARSRRASVLAGQFVKDGGLQDVIQKAPDLNALDQYMIAKQGLAVSKNGITTGRNAVKDAQLVKDLAPQYEALAQQANQYSRKLLQYSVDSGLVSQDLANSLIKKYPDYVPINRIFNEDELANIQQGKGKGIASLSSQSVVQKLKGSERAIESPIASLVAKTKVAFDQGERNIAASQLASYRDLPGNPFGITAVKEGQASGKTTFSAMINGKKQIFETSPEVAAAAKSLNKEQVGTVLKIVSYATRLLRLGATGLNYPFAVANLVKDQSSAFINSENALATSSPKAFTKGLFAAAGHGELYDEMVRNAGGGTSWDIGRVAPNVTVADIRANASTLGKIGEIIKNPIRTVEDLIGRTEEWTRAQQYSGTYDSLIKQGRTPQDAKLLAAKAARENTVDFAQGGTFSRVLNYIIPYFNAGVQGSRTLVRNISTRPVQTLGKFALGVGMPVAAVTLWNLSDPKRKAAYQDITESEKQNSMVIVPPNPTKDAGGKWNVWKIPLSQEIASLTTPIRRPLEQSQGLDPVTFGEIANAVLQAGSSLNTQTPTGLVSSLTPQAIKPGLEVTMNKNLYTGQDIVPSYMQSLPADQQVKPNTSGTARLIAKPLGISPLMVQNEANTILGGLGSQLLNTSDQALNKAGVIPSSQVGGKSLGNALQNRFLKASGGQTLTNLYDSVDNANKTSGKVDLNQQVIDNGKVYYPTIVKHKDGTTGYAVSSDPYKGFDTTQQPTYTQSPDSPQGLSRIGLYATAAVDSPSATLNAIVTGQPIRKISGKTVVLERQNGLAAIDNGDVATQVDHKIALALGGTNDQNNLQILSATDNAAKGQVEVYLLGLLKSGKITTQEAQQRDLNWKNEIPNLSSVAQNKIVTAVNNAAVPSNPTLQYQIKDPVTGNRTNIDLTPITPPTYTGNDIIDKQLKSNYTSAINKQIKDIIAVQQDGQMSIAEASSMLDKLSKVSTSLKKGKKPPKVTFKATKFTTPKITLAKGKSLKLPTIKFAKPKITKTTIKRYQIKA
jgi:hypothetical protein